MSLVLALLAAAGPAGCGGGEADERSATLEGDGFSVRMPGGMPRRTVIGARSAAGRVRVTAYVSQRFSVSVARLPEGVRGDLDAAVRGAAANVDGTLEQTVRTTYRGFPARDARISRARDRSGRTGTVFARVILARGRLLQLGYVSDEDRATAAPAAYRTFLSSLRIR